MHRSLEGATKPEFSTENMQTYIKFCRIIKPKFTNAAAVILRDEYKKLRLQECSKNAYKVTVRQLESLIRLSEAMARAHCDDEIKPIYV
jgi:DNA replication licensing factor MCM6